MTMSNTTTTTSRDALIPDRIDVSLQHLAAGFDEWARRWADNPGEFREILDSNGRPLTGYGERCATYLSWLLVELSASAVAGDETAAQLGGEA